MRRLGDYPLPLRPPAWLLGAGEQPGGLGPAFRIDLSAVALWTAMFSLGKYGISGTIAFRAMAASPAVLALVAAGPGGGNTLSLLWAWLGRGRSLVKMLMAATGLASLCTAGVALVPLDRPLLFAALVVGIFIARAGIFAFRTAVWREMYQQVGVGSVASRLVVLELLLGIGLTWGAGAVLDLGTGNFRWMFLLAGAMGLVSMLNYARLLGHARRTPRSNDPEAGDISAAQPRLPRWAGLKILARDPLYRRYQAFNMLFGLGSQMLMPVALPFIELRWRVGYAEMAGVLVILPALAMAAVMPLGGRLVDRTNPMRMRAIEAAGWIIAACLLLVAAWTGAILWVILAQLVAGLGLGFGNIAWYVGPLQFARRELSTVYVGINVTSVGIRGLVGPFLGLGLWAGSYHLPAIGLGVMGVIIALCVVGFAGLIHMDRHHARIRPADFTL